MTTNSQETLYKLLPAIYRQRDLQQGEPLRALLAIMEQELSKMEWEIDKAYANCFIETCAPEILPYIADLVGIPNLHDAKEIPINQRARIANTIHYRRRKGQAATVERVITDVTGWRAKIVDYTHLVAMTQHILHPRPNRGMTAHIRDQDAMDTLNSPFDRSAHMVEVSKSRPLMPEYRIGNLGIYLWRLPVYAIQGATACAIPTLPGCYTFNPLGLDTALFNNPPSIDEFIESAAEAELPVAIRRVGLQTDLNNYQRPEDDNSVYYGPERSINLILDEKQKKPSQIVVRDLSGWDLSTWKRPDGDKIVIDPKLGRIALPQSMSPKQLTVNYCYAFSSELGGGPYNRQATLANFAKPIIITQGGNHLSEAITLWLKNSAPNGIFQINDNATYELPDDLTAKLNKRKLVIQANDGVRPCIRLLRDITVSSDNAANPLEITLNGLLLDGSIKLGQNVELNIIHSTLVPNRAYSLVVDASVSLSGDQSKITIDHSIVGPIFLPKNVAKLTIRDSIVDGLGKIAIAAGPEKKSGPATELERSTLFGSVHVVELPLASEIISTGIIEVERVQNGCVRYSYLPLESTTPPRYRCQPELNLGAHQTHSEVAEVVNALTPRFTSTTYGDPGYAQLSQDCDVAITAGAENGSEMGVFQHLQQPQRKEQLSKIIDEYVPYCGGLLIISYLS